MWLYRCHDRSSIHGVLDPHTFVRSIPTTQTLTVSDSSPLDRKGPYSSNIVGVSFGHLVKASTARPLAKQVRKQKFWYYHAIGLRAVRLA